MPKIPSITSACKYKDRYYYAGGRRSELKLEPAYLCVDTTKADNSPEIIAKVTAAGSILSGGAILIAKATLSSKERKSLAKDGAIRSVYRFHYGLMILLPEVRVEFESGQREEVLEVSKDAKVPFEITEDKDNRLILHPQSDCSEDALDLACYIYERAVGVLSSAACMLQIMKRPDTSRR